MHASATRSSHLEVWHQIARRRHSSTTPVRGHFDFIDGCVEKLDAIGFRWDKDSILGILYQIGLPSVPSNQVTPVNTNGMSACAVKQALETAQASSPRPLALMPVEIINKIIGYLESIDQHENEIRRDGKSKRSLKSFALISRRFWELSRPWLWETARFPAFSDTPNMIHWTRDILPKHGSFVRSIFVSISQVEMYPDYISIIEGRALKRNSARFQNPTQFKEGDTLPQADKSDKTFLTILIKSLAMCPNATSLEIYLPRMHFQKEDDSADPVKEIEIFLLKLIPQISRLRKLRHVTLESLFHIFTMNDFFPQFIKSLSMLESFSNSGFTTSFEKGAQSSFESDLSSKLQHLSTLELNRIPLDDPIWRLDPRPQRIKTLRLSYTADQMPSAAAIYQIAPNVEILHIHERSSFGRDEENVAPTTTGLNSNDRLFLPFLHDLHIGSSENLLMCFTGCKALRKLSLLYNSGEDFGLVENLLGASTWPLIKSVTLRRSPFDRLGGPHSGGRDKRKSLKRFCDQSNISLCISR